MNVSTFTCATGLVATRVAGFFLAASLAFAAGANATPAKDGQEVFRRFALAVGSNLGGPSRDTLLYADSDARAFGSLLAEMGGVASADVQVLRGPAPEALDAAFRELRARVAAHPRGKGRTEVIVYYSGHADDRGLLLDGKTFAYDRFRRQIDSIPADVRIAVLDACASGAITRLKGGRRRPAFAVDASSDMRGYAFLTSSSPDEASQESDQIRSSFFTHYLVSGLRGAADVSGDGKVTLGEAYQFAFHETLARTERTKGGPQHPAYDMKLSGTGDVVMTDTRQTSAGLILGKDLEGRFFVRGRDNQLVAELYKPAGRVVELGLAPGAYTIRLEREKLLATSSLDLAEGRRSELSAGDFVSLSPEATVSRGGPADSGIPAAPAPADTVSAAPKPMIELRDTWDIPAGNNQGTLSLGLLLNNQREPFRGVQLTLFFNHAARSVHGGQVSALGNIVQGPLSGFQGSAIGNISLDTTRSGQAAGMFNFSLAGGTGGQGAGILNVSGSLKGGMGAGIANLGMGKVEGGQGAGLLNLSRGLTGGQGAGAANFNVGPAKGGQGAGLVNLTGGMEGGMGAGIANLNYGRLHGGQGAGLLNVSRGVRGGQAAGVVNLSFGDVAGAQAAGLFNAARDVKGAQVAGCLNIARDVDGFQFGLVNISRDFRGGIPVGLLNYSHLGQHSADFWADDLGYQHATFVSGPRSYYMYYSIGKKLASDRNLLALGLGLGFQRPWGRNHLSADAGAFQLIEDWDFDNDGSADGPELFRVRLQAGREVLPYLSLFGGATLNWIWNLSDRSENLPWEDYPVEPFKGQFAWPGLFAGIRLGR